MPESTQYYFDLSLAEQADLLHGLAPVLGRRAEILEKDIWLCQTLGVLFKHMQTLLGTHMSERACQEVRRTHPVPERPKHMFDRAASKRHGIWLAIQALLNLLKHLFMLPAPRRCRIDH